MMDKEQVRRIFYETRSVEETARRLGIDMAIAHWLIQQSVGSRPVTVETFNHEQEENNPED